MRGDTEARDRRRRVRPTHAGLLAGVLVLTLLAAAPGAGAAVGDRLERTRDELAALAEQLGVEAAAADALRAEVAAADARVGEATERLGMLLDARLTIADEVASAQARYEAARAELESVAVETFMGMAGGNPDAFAFGAAFDATTLADVGDAVAYASAVGDAQAATAARVVDSKERLESRATTLEALLDERSAALDELEDARSSLTAALVEHARAQDALEASREQLLTLVRRLAERDRAAALGGVGSAFRGPYHVSYGAWALRFLDALGAPPCRNNRVVVVAWQVQESTQAAWNPLATTRDMPGATDFNWVGVKNYRSIGQGIAASLGTLDHGYDVYRYGAIVQDLRRCADPYATASSIAASSWCPGCLDGMYVVGLIPNVDADLTSYAAL
jgi:hypothetical protein